MRNFDLIHNMIKILENANCKLENAKVVSLKGIDVEVITFKVTGQTRYVDQPLHQIKLPKNTIIGVIVRDEKIFVPTGKNMIKPGDEIVVFSGKSSVNELEKIFA